MLQFRFFLSFLASFRVLCILSLLNFLHSCGHVKFNAKSFFNLNKCLFGDFVSVCAIICFFLFCNVAGDTGKF
jgi:hypothetical protein